MTKIAISLDDEVAHELAQLAREAELSEEALVRETIERLVEAHHAPAIPRFARRLGPLTSPALPASPARTRPAVRARR